MVTVLVMVSNAHSEQGHQAVEPVPENREKLVKWLLDAFSSSAFNACSYQELPAMSGELMKITLKPDAPLTSVKYRQISSSVSFQTIC